MVWYVYVGWFFAGAFLANAIPRGRPRLQRCEQPTRGLRYFIDGTVEGRGVLL